MGSNREDGKMEKTHVRFMIWMFPISIFIFLMVFSFILWPYYHNFFSWRHYWSFYCFIFLLLWWITYFGSEQLNIFSLRLFLDKHSCLRNSTQQENPTNQQPGNPTGAELTKEEQYIINKCTSTIMVQGIFIAVVAVFLTLVLQSPHQNEYEEFLRPFILITALATIILMIFAIDLLDTVLNLFNRSANESFNSQVYFYRNLGALAPKGGISYA